jgi:ABC-type uncharacterized transport system permease subunit
MNTIAICVLLAIAFVIYRAHANRGRHAEEQRIDREVANIVSRLIQTTPEFFSQSGLYTAASSTLEFEFRWLPVYRAAFKRRMIKLEEAPKAMQVVGYSHQLRFFGNTIPVKNYVDITETAFVERVA